MIYLSYLERWIAWRIYEGAGYRQIGREIGYSLSLISARIKRIYHKAGICSRLRFCVWWESNRSRCRFYKEAL